MPRPMPSLKKNMAHYSLIPYENLAAMNMAYDQAREFTPKKYTREVALVHFAVKRVMQLRDRMLCAVAFGDERLAM